MRRSAPCRDGSPSASSAARLPSAWRPAWLVQLGDGDGHRDDAAETFAGLFDDLHGRDSDALGRRHWGGRARGWIKQEGPPLAERHLEARPYVDDRPQRSTRAAPVWRPSARYRYLAAHDLSPLPPSASSSSPSRRCSRTAPLVWCTQDDEGRGDRSGRLGRCPVWPRSPKQGLTLDADLDHPRPSRSRRRRGRDAGEDRASTSSARIRTTSSGSTASRPAGPGVRPARGAQLHARPAGWTTATR